MQALAQQRPLARLRQHTVQPCADVGELAARVGGFEEVDFLLGKIQRRLHQHAQVDHALDQRMHGLREHAVERTRGRARGGFGAGLDQVGDGFGLGQVQLVVEEGAARKLAGLGHAQADAVAGPQAARQQQLHHHRAAVALQLEHILAGVGMRRRKPQRDAPINGRAIGVEEGR